MGRFRGLGLGQRNVVADAHPPRVPRKGRKVWTVSQLQTFLQRSRPDRFFALWVLEATSGMRRCELAGARRDLLDLDAGTLEIEATRVVVDGKVIESDGKTENAQHVLALDPFTLAVLKAHVEMLDAERKDFGPDYHDHGWLFCWENGKPPHPDTITRRFKKLAKAAGLPAIDLHDVRHSYATAGRNAKIDWKALSKRIGHADVAFTMKQYVQTDLEADREVANTLANLIIGGLLVTGIDGQADTSNRACQVRVPGRHLSSGTRATVFPGGPRDRGCRLAAAGRRPGFLVMSREAAFFGFWPLPVRLRELAGAAACWGRAGLCPALDRLPGGAAEARSSRAAAGP
ncbi:MAG TPA: site-specific integrase [Streptosporangiaceae bacterium]|nr:site-specific integrase [Streptosporangiaceae bacterium]